MVTQPCGLFQSSILRNLKMKFAVAGDFMRSIRTDDCSIGQDCFSSTTSMTLVDVAGLVGAFAALIPSSLSFKIDESKFDIGPNQLDSQSATDIHSFLTCDQSALDRRVQDSDPGFLLICASDDRVKDRANP